MCEITYTERPWTGLVRGENSGEEPQSMTTLSDYTVQQNLKFWLPDSRLRRSTCPAHLTEEAWQCKMFTCSVPKFLGSWFKRDYADPSPLLLALGLVSLQMPMPIFLEKTKGKTGKRENTSVLKSGINHQCELILAALCLLWRNWLTND